MRKPALIGFGLLGLCLLAGCGTKADNTTPSVATATSGPSTTNGPAHAVEYGTVAALKDAAVAAGYICPSWDQTNQVTDAAESGSCSDQDVFMTFTSQTGRDHVVALLKKSGHAQLLVGPNWVINSPAERPLQDTLGGVVVTSGAQ